MKILLVLIFAVACHHSSGYPVNETGEISAEISTANEDSSEYLFELANVTSSNDSFLLHGVLKKIGGGIKGGIKSIKTKIGNIKGKIGKIGNDNTKTRIGTGNGRYIGGIGTRNSGSGVKDPENAKWALIGIGVTFLVTAAGLTAYYLYTSRRKRYSKCQIPGATGNLGL